jgi:hypothetical protein
MHKIYTVKLLGPCTKTPHRQFIWPSLPLAPEQPTRACLPRHHDGVGPLTTMTPNIPPSIQHQLQFSLPFVEMMEVVAVLLVGLSDRLPSADERYFIMRKCG